MCIAEKLLTMESKTPYYNVRSQVPTTRYSGHENFLQGGNNSKMKQ